MVDALTMFGECASRCQVDHPATCQQGLVPTVGLYLSDLEPIDVHFIVFEGRWVRTGVEKLVHAWLGAPVSTASRRH